MINIVQFVLALVGTIFGVIWILMFWANKNKYNDIVETIDSEKFFMADTFFVGFGGMSLIGYQMDTRKDIQKIHEFSEIYGSKYAKYHYYVLRGGQFTYMMTFLPLSFLIGAVLNSPLYVVIVFLLSFLLAYRLESEVNEEIGKRREELLMDFPNMISKLMLLINSGMTLKEAWNKIAISNQGQLYIEMQNTVLEMNNGVAEIQAYMNFADRCYVKEIRKFASMMVQNMQKGSAELLSFLGDMAKEMWETKRHIAKRRADAAASKLMIPTFIIFIGILVLIMVPMLSGMSI